MEEARRCLHLHDQRRESASSRGGTRAAIKTRYLTCVKQREVLGARSERRRTLGVIRPSGRRRSRQSGGMRFRHMGKYRMRKFALAALGAAMMLTSAPAWSQELPLKTGDFWDVAAITIDD